MSEVSPTISPPSGKVTPSEAHESQDHFVVDTLPWPGLIHPSRGTPSRPQDRLPRRPHPARSTYLLSFLDRSNIGNAKLEGLVADIKLKDYSTALTLFFVGYVIGEVPANIVLKKTSPPVWLPTLTLVWGIISVVQGLVHNQAGCLR